MSNFSFLKTEDGMPDICQHNLDRSGHFLQLIGNILNCNILVDGHGVVGSPAYFQREVDTFGPGGNYEEVAHSSF